MRRFGAARRLFISGFAGIQNSYLLIPNHSTSRLLPVISSGLSKPSSSSMVGARSASTPPAASAFTSSLANQHQRHRIGRMRGKR